MAKENGMIGGMYQGDGFGVGGINGMHHNTLGWDNTTVGMASSIFDNILSQHGVRTNDPNYIGALEPLRTGRFIVKWLKVPPFFNETAVKYLRFFLENNVRGIDGLTGNTISSISGSPFGAVGQEMDFPGGYKEGNKEVTLTTITCTGDGFGKLMRYWKYGITDPITGVHHMYGKDLRFIRPNYAGSLLYILLGPTARPGDIEYACIWHECWPTGSDGKDIYNGGTLGEENATTDRTETFTGLFQDGPEVNILAKYVVAGLGLAGQSYFDQMLPAYIYEQFLNKLQTSDTDTIKAISVAQNDKLNGQSEIYTSDIIKSREEVRKRYGIDTNDPTMPSSTWTSEQAINDLNSYGTEQFTESIMPATRSS